MNKLTIYLSGTREVTMDNLSDSDISNMTFEKWFSEKNPIKRFLNNTFYFSDDVKTVCFNRKDIVGYKFIK